MGWDILLFDLDGTLTDSGPGIMHAAKTALQSFGIGGLSEQELRYFVGPPLWESFGKYLPEEQISAAIDRFREYYRVTGWLENEPYPGVRECLQALQGAGKRMYVATSKLETMARQVLAHFDLLQYFAIRRPGRRSMLCDGSCGRTARTIFPARSSPVTGNMTFWAAIRRACRPSACCTATAAARS